MSKLAKGIVFTGCLSASLIATSAIAGEGNATGSVRVSANVPMACWVDHSVRADAASGEQGLVREGCNNGAGYIVSAEHRPLDVQEHAKLRYGQTIVDLSKETHQEVNREYGPKIQDVAYSFSEIALASSLTLSLTIQPL
ncbi:MAG: hypothetical protein ACK5NN_01090 [Sphingomonadaceae bacterium]